MNGIRSSPPGVFLRDNVYAIVFAVSIAALIALGAWWTVFIGDAIERGRDFHIANLRQSQRYLALYYSREPAPPPPGRSAIDGRFGIAPCGARAPGDRWVMQLNAWDGLCLRPHASIVSGIERKYERQKVMVIGEGGLLFVLVGVSAFMLLRLFRSERRFTRELERFVEVLTHRLKGPATGLSALLETIRMGRVGGAQMKELVDLGLLEIERQQQIINNILMACREREEPWRMQVTEVRLRPLVGELLGRCRSLAGESTKVEVDIGDTEGVMADENALRIVLENIIDNAFKYSPSGEAAISVSVEHPKDGMTLLNVTDRGMGIRQEDLPRLFEPLWRGSKVRRGSGLGLYLSRRIVRRMGGDVTVRSEGEGKGTAVTVALPAALEQTQARLAIGAAMCQKNMQGVRT